MLARFHWNNGTVENIEIPDKEPPPVLQKQRLIDSVSGASEVVLFRLQKKSIQSITGHWIGDYYETNS